MRGASFETTLELWASSLRMAKARMRPVFGRERMARAAGLFLDGLLGPERRKTGWMRAEAAGDPGPWRQQAVLGRGRWEADALRDLVRDYALEALADAEAVLVIDETGFLKQGRSSCGVARQYTGSAGKVTNCRIGVFAAYVSRLPKGGRVVGGRGAAVPGLGGQGHHLPERRLRGLRVPPRPRLRRPGAPPAQGLGRRSGPPGGGARAARGGLRHQAAAGRAHGR